MANNLTGDFEAVLQISVRKLNAILATMHQRGAEPHASPSFPHSGSLQVGQSRFSDETTLFHSWIIAAIVAVPSRTLSSGTAVTRLAATIPPGVSEYFHGSVTALQAALDTSLPFGEGVRGKADFQVSNPTITFPSAASAVTIHVKFRANYAPDPGSDALPATIHGSVDAVYLVTTKPSKQIGGPPILSVHVSADDNLITFKSELTVTAADQNRISAQIRKLLRTQFAPADQQLPGGFAFSAFKGLGNGAVLPLRLPNSPVPAGNIASVTNPFLGPSDFAIAVSREYVQKFLDQFVDKIRKAAEAIRFFIKVKVGIPPVEVTVVTVNYQGSLSSSSVVWKNGSIEIAGAIDVISDHPHLAPSGHVTFTQSIAVVLDVPNQTVSVKPLGDPVVHASGPISEDDARKRIIGPRDTGIAEATGFVSETFRAAQEKLTSAVRSFDLSSARVRYTALDLTPDGIVVRGAIDTSSRLAPFKDPKEIGNRFTAFGCWIPGGWITKYTWSWEESKGKLIWGTTTKKIEDEHGFSIPTPAAVALTGRICLELEGTRISSDGVEENVTAGHVCSPSWHEPVLFIPPWAFEANVPIWIPRFPDQVLADGIVGHLNIVAGLRGPNSMTPNTLVHFAGSNMERPLEGLSRALSQLRVRNHSLTTILVLPEGTLNNRRSEVEAKIGALDERLASVNLLVTEDFQGGWTKIFAAPYGPSTHLVNARGEFVWNQMGTLDGYALTAALDERLVPARGARMAPLRLTVQPGEPMPDNVFTDDEGHQTAARRLRGENVLLTFWKSWSAPCIQELRRLQRLLHQQHPPFILAINGGEDRTVFADVRGRNKFTFPLIHDPLQAIAMQYGVQCWPTTVSVNREGLVDHVQFGLTHDDAYSEKTADA